LQDLLARIGERVSLTIERFHSVTANASTLIEKILRQVKLIRTLRYAIIRVAHLATRFGIFFLIHGIQPVFVPAVTLDGARRGAAVTTVAGRTTKLLRIVRLEQLFARVTDKRARKFVRLLAGSIRRHV